MWPPRNQELPRPSPRFRHGLTRKWPPSAARGRSLRAAPWIMTPCRLNLGGPGQSQVGRGTYERGCGHHPGRPEHGLESQARGADAAAGQPARPRGGRDRHRQDRDAPGIGRRILQCGRPGLRRRHQGRPVRARRRRRGQASLHQAGRGTGHRLRARPVPHRVLGPVRRAGSPDPLHDHRDGPAAAGAPARTQRHPGGRAQHCLPGGRREPVAAHRPEGSARAPHLPVGERQGAVGDLRQCLVRFDRRDPAGSARAGEPGRR